MEKESILEVDHLKQQLQHLTQELNSVIQSRQQITNLILEVEQTAQSKAQEVKNNSKRRYDQLQQQALAIINSKTGEKYTEVNNLLDTFPDLLKKDIAGKLEMQSVCEMLKLVCPIDIVDNHICEKYKEYPDDAVVFSEYETMERIALILSKLKRKNPEERVGILSSLYNFFLNLLALSQQRLGVETAISLIVLLVIIGFIYVKPMALLTILSIITGISTVRGIALRTALDRFHSIRRYISISYDVDVFEKDKSDVLNSVGSYLMQVQTDYIDKIRSIPYREPEDEINSILQQGKQKSEQYQLNLKAIEDKLSELESNIKETQDKLSQAEQDKLNAISKLRESLFSTINLKSEWYPNIITDITDDGRVFKTPNVRGNTIYFADDVSDLNQFCKLSVYQNLINMSPDYASQLVIDYKYMGGQLMQLQSIPQLALRIVYSNEEIEERITAVDNDMQSRAVNILQSCKDVESFNTLMQQYGSTGENYWIVHMVGLSSVTDKLRYFLQNGAKIGYFFRIYLSTADLKSIVKDMPLQNFSYCGRVSSYIQPINPAQLIDILK